MVTGRRSPRGSNRHARSRKTPVAAGRGTVNFVAGNGRGIAEAENPLDRLIVCSIEWRSLAMPDRIIAVEMGLVALGGRLASNAEGDVQEAGRSGSMTRTHRIFRRVLR